MEVFSNEPNDNESHSEVTEICDDKIQNKKSSINKKSINHTLQRKRQKTVDYRNNSFEKFRLMIVDPLQKLYSEEWNVLPSYFGISSEKQSNEVIFKILLTHLLNNCEDSKI